MQTEISASNIKKMIPKANIIDIRDNYKYNLGSIPTSVNIPAKFLINNPELYLKKDTTYYLCCDYGNTSKRLCNILRNLGYSVINITGGFNEYKLL